jgi:hypothetical protein
MTHCASHEHHWPADNLNILWFTSGSNWGSAAGCLRYSRSAARSQPASHLWWPWDAQAACILCGIVAGTPAAQNKQLVSGTTGQSHKAVSLLTDTASDHLHSVMLTSNFVKSILLARLKRLAAPLRAVLPKYCRQTQDGTMHISDGSAGPASPASL